MTAAGTATGWDIGGAHLKAAQSDAAGRVRTALQVPCTLWLGLEHLERALASALAQLAPTARHGVTMTGELVDLFTDRAEGVRQLLRVLRAACPSARLRVYAGAAGFVAAEESARFARAIASANWHASARFAAARCQAGLLVDVGSTTTDLVPFAGGEVRATAGTDAERLVARELVYAGVTRTPVMAIARSVRFAGRTHPLMAELFATAADVHRLTGELPEDADQHPSADGRGKSEEDSARRLARMLGLDLADAPLASWRRVARGLAARQLQLIRGAAERVLARGALDAGAPLVGAGAGRFLVVALARRLARPYVDFATLVAGSPQARERAARCAPAVAVAALAAAED
jgi:probable H4MPT-linked C1 transfer pathway protein